MKRFECVSPSHFLSLSLSHFPSLSLSLSLSFSLSLALACELFLYSFSCSFSSVFLLKQLFSFCFSLTMHKIILALSVFLHFLLLFLICNVPFTLSSFFHFFLFQSNYLLVFHFLFLSLLIFLNICFSFLVLVFVIRSLKSFFVCFPCCCHCIFCSLLSSCLSLALFHPKQFYKT